MTRRPATIAAIAVMVGTALWLATAIAAERGTAAMLRADPEAVLNDPTLRRVALATGEPVYRARCAGCHGAAGAGDPTIGAPNLTDTEHLYGDGTVLEIEMIARHGIRSGDPRGWRLAAMPAYASARPYKAEPLPPLTPAQIEDVTQFLMGLGSRATDQAAAARGGALYQDVAGCWDCHGRNAAGDPAIGAPSLTDDVWLYGRGHDAIYRSIARGRGGHSPAFRNILTAAELRGVAVYVAALQPATAKTAGQQ